MLGLVSDVEGRGIAMPFTSHRLIAYEDKKPTCLLCKQTWSSWKVRSACPGVPVYPFEEVPSYLKTFTALGRERKYPPDPDKWDGAYRVLKAPYYRLLYDERKAIHQPLTEKQIAANEKRKVTQRERYGCRLCDTYYRKEDVVHFSEDKVCLHCQNGKRSWNELLAWASHIMHEEPLILDIFTHPIERAVTDAGGKTPDCYYDPIERKMLFECFKPDAYQLIGYQTMHLLSGEIERRVEQIATQDELSYLQYLLSPYTSSLLPPPFVLMATSMAREIAYQAAWRGYGSEEHKKNENMDFVPKGYHYIARTGRTWTNILERGQHGHTERGMLEHACQTCDVVIGEQESIASMIRRFVLHLASQPEVV